jgi:hypothetical protein
VKPVGVTQNVKVGTTTQGGRVGTTSITNINTNVNIRIYSVMPFGGNFAHHHHHPGTQSGSTNVTTAVNVNTYGGKTYPNNKKTTGSNGTPVVAYSGGLGGGMSSGYPSSGTTSQGGGGQPSQGSLASDVGIVDDNAVAQAQQPTTDVAVEDAGGLLNVRGGGVKVTGRQPDGQLVNDGAEGPAGHGVQGPPGPDREPGEEQPAAPASRETVGQNEPGKQPVVPVVPSLIGLAVGGASLFFGWKKFR